MKTIKHPVKSTKNFVSKHRVAIAVTLTAALALKWQMSTAAQWNAFLKDHGLYDEYYATLEDA